MIRKHLGIYIHIPFCVSKCAYCDFYSLPKITDELKNDYVRALIRDMEQTAPVYKDAIIDTVFVGGGTPTLLPIPAIYELTGALKRLFNLSEIKELTFEANPATFDSEKLSVMKECGVTRLSIGMQSACENELSALGRIHSFSDTKKAVELARKCGFDNLNLDIMYGIPYQTKDSFISTLEKACELSPEHISVYGLQIEEGTPLCKNKKSYVFPTEDEEYDMTMCIPSILKEKGYHRYEISNYAKEGFECKHNLGYWTQGEYLGFGCGAYSFSNGERYYREKDLDAYLACEDFNTLTVTDERLAENDKVEEFIMLSLRLASGLSIEKLKGMTGEAEKYIERAKKFVKLGLMKEKNGHISFTDEGFNVSNGIISEIIYG